MLAQGFRLVQGLHCIHLARVSLADNLHASKVALANARHHLEVFDGRAVVADGGYVGGLCGRRQAQE